jgi:hypothetical protein
MLATDREDVGLLEVREIELDLPDAAAAAAEGPR